MARKSPERTTYRVQVLERAVDILQLLSEDSRELSVAGEMGDHAPDRRDERSGRCRSVQATRKLRPLVAARGACRAQDEGSATKYYRIVDWTPAPNTVCPLVD